MRMWKARLLAMMMLAGAALPADAAVIVNSANTGYNFTVDYVGQVNGVTTPSVSALGTFTYTGLSNNGLTYNFNYSLLNDSTQTARLSGFGFNTTPNPTSASVTGAFNNSYIGGNYPEGYGTTDFCFTDSGGSCAGGGNGGFYGSSNPGTGSFAITFGQTMASVSFDNFVTRFQSIGQQGNSGIGIGSLVSGGTITAPEPGTWLTMLVGFGLVGGAMRQRGRKQAIRQAL